MVLWLHVGQSAEDYTRRLRNTSKKKVVHFQHFLAETPSQGSIFYEKLVWPPKILTTWSIFFCDSQKMSKTMQN